MSTSWPDLTRLLADLVRTPSPSGEEAAAAAVLATWAERHGLMVTADETGVRIEVDGAAPGPTLLLASHLDTVPAGEDWTRDPHGAHIEGAWLHGRGAVDAKGPVAAMAAAAADLAASGGPPRGKVVVLAAFAEETANATLGAALSRMPRPDAAIVGEPTSLEPAIAQRGLVVLRLKWSGRATHAGWAAQEDAARSQEGNAIVLAASDLASLAAASFDRVHPVLGRVALSPTRIEAGTASNVIPASCTAILDIRTTPRYEPHEIVARIREATRADIEVVSQRFLPCETPPGSAVLEAIRRVRPWCVPFGSPTASDWVFLRDLDAVKLGPGDSRLSHTSEERISIDEVAAAAKMYAAIAREWALAATSAPPDLAALEAERGTR